MKLPGESDYVDINLADPDSSVPTPAPLLLSDLIVEASDGGYYVGPDSVVSGFGANELPAGSYGGTDYVQVALSRENLQVESQDYDDDDWSNIACVITPEQTDPAGNATADKLTPDTDLSGHGAADACNADGSSSYCVSLFVKNNGYKYTEITLGPGKFVGSPAGLFNVDTGVVDTATDCIADIVSVGDGWYRCGVKAVSDAAGAASNSFPRIRDNSKTITYSGDGTSGQYCWQPQFEVGSYPGPIIHTEAAPVTRAADAAYWQQADIPAAFTTGKYQIKIIPWWDSDSDTADYYILDTSDETVNLVWDGIAKAFILSDGVNIIETDVIGITRDTVITLSWDPVAGTLTVAGADSGDGTYEGNAISMAVAEGEKLYLGSSNIGVEQFDGRLSGLTPWS